MKIKFDSGITNKEERQIFQDAVNFSFGMIIIGQVDLDRYNTSFVNAIKHVDWKEAHSAWYDADKGIINVKMKNEAR